MKQVNFKIYLPDKTISSVEIYSDEGEFLKKEKVPANNLVTDQMSFGIICSIISKGESLDNAASGEGFRISTPKFLMLCRASQEYRLMYQHAKICRIDSVREEIIKLARKSENEKVVSSLKNVLQVLEVDLRDMLEEDEEEETKDRNFEIKTFVSKKKLQEIESKAKDSLAIRPNS